MANPEPIFIKTMQNQSEPVPSFDEIGQQIWAMYLDNFWTEPSTVKIGNL